MSNLVRTTRTGFWNNFHQVRSKSKNWKAKQFKPLCVWKWARLYRSDVAHLAVSSSTLSDSTKLSLENLIKV